MLRTLGGNSAHGLANLSPAGPGFPSGVGGLLTQTVRGSSELVGKLESGQRGTLLVHRVGHYISAAFLEQSGDERFHGEHRTSIASMAAVINYVLTTMC